MNLETLTLVRGEDGVAVVTLDRPEVLNSIDPTMIAELRAVLADVGSDPAVRCLLVTGAGRAFCAGADLSVVHPENEGMSPGEDIYWRMERAFNPLSRELAAFPKPMVAAVNGVAAGGGVGLALAADIVVAARSASFVQVFGPQLGLVPDMGCTYYLVRLLGRARARALAMLGDRLGAEQAAEWGLVWKCVDDDALLGEARGLAQRLAAGPAECYRHMKRVLDVAELAALTEQLDLERDTQRILGDTADFAEGVTAFFSKRKPKFSGT